MTKDELFQRLVENALDFLRKAIQELDDQPKYSMISFHAAMELFIKARLVAEHWTLIVTRQQEPDWSRIVSGEFQSVNLQDAEARLSKVVGSGLSRKEYEAFDDVAKHRNKTLHFFHEAHTDKEATELRLAVIKQQLTAWYFLHKLLTERWGAIFKPWARKIAAIDQELRCLHEYLAVVFADLKEAIEQKTEEGLLCKTCPSCDFDAQMHDDEKDVVYETECLVCGLTGRGLQIDCPGCDATVTFQNEGFAICNECGNSLEPDDVVKALRDEAVDYIAMKDGGDVWGPGNCSDCDGYGTVVFVDDEDYVCASCFARFEFINCCEWCNVPNTGDMEGSYWSGCNYCDGKGGWDNDD